MTVSPIAYGTGGFHAPVAPWNDPVVKSVEQSADRHFPNSKPVYSTPQTERKSNALFALRAVAGI